MTSGSSALATPIAFEAELKDWVTTCLKERVEQKKDDNSHDSQGFEWKPLSGDAGFRHYFRIVLDHTSLIAVYSPVETENNQGFFEIDNFLFKHGVHVPKILAYEEDKGFFLLEDLGEKMYLDYLNEETASVLYGEALFSLLRIQQCPQDTSIFPAYDAPRLLAELELFETWFVNKMLNYTLDEQEQTLLRETFATLIDSALSQPQVIVHRDYHSRNIAYGMGGSPGIIDFQDAVIGPVTYDLVSLLRDCYIEWPADQVERWAIAYGNMAMDAGILPLISEQRFLSWFDLMGLQRHIKVMGIFARLAIRDQKQGYLNDLPLVLRYVQSVAKKHEALDGFAQWFDSKIMPLADEQSWMQRT